MVLLFEDLRQPYVLVDGLESFLDVLTLILVEILKLFGLVRFFVQGDGTVAVSLSRGVCVYRHDLAIRLELCGELIDIVIDEVIRRAVLFIERGVGGMTRYRVVFIEAGLDVFEGGVCRSLSGTK